MSIAVGIEMDPGQAAGGGQVAASPGGTSQGVRHGIAAPSASASAANQAGSFQKNWQSMLASLGLEEGQADRVGQADAETGPAETKAGSRLTQQQSGASGKVLSSGGQSASRDATPAGAVLQDSAVFHGRTNPQGELPDSGASGTQAGSKAHNRPEGSGRAHETERKRDGKAQSVPNGSGTVTAPLATANQPLPIAAPVTGSAPTQAAPVQTGKEPNRDSGSPAAGWAQNRAGEHSAAPAPNKTPSGGEGVRAASSDMGPANGSTVDGSAAQASDAARDKSASAEADAVRADQPQQRGAVLQLAGQGTSLQAAPVNASGSNRAAEAAGSGTTESPLSSPAVETSSTAASKHPAKESAAGSTHGAASGSPAERAKQFEGGPAGSPGDAAALVRDQAGGRGMTNGVGNGVGGGAMASSNTMGTPSGSETFAALDAGTGVGAPGWVHAGSQGAEAGFQDPALGWVGVRADMSGGVIHASLLPGSADAAQALSGHLAGLSAHLAAQHTAVGSLAVASPEAGRAGWGSGQGSNQGSGQGSNQGPNQGSNQGPSQGFNQGAQQGFGQPAQNSGQGGSSMHQAYVEAGLRAVSGAAPTGGATQPSSVAGANAARGGGAYISVVA
jgi:hypothetical protein